jgi:hypothetical protein
MKSVDMPSADRRASDVLFVEVAASRNSSRRDNIRAIRAVCDQMEHDRVVINAAEVTRRCGENGPAYSTVSNKGSKLGEYIKLRMMEQAASLTPAPRSDRSLADTVLDPVLAAQIRDKEHIARWVRKENKGLRNLLKNLSPGFDIDAALVRVAEGVAPALIEKTRQTDSVDSEVLGVLLRLMDHLVGERQYEILRGRLTINRKVILGERELAVYRKATGLSDDEWQRRYHVDQGESNGER